MKIGLIIIGILATIASYGQPDCSKVKYGSFKQADEGNGELVITRKGKTQIEENTKIGLKISLDVVWTSDCTYELKNAKVLKGDFPQMPEGVVLYNEIIEVTNKYYRVRSWMNFAPDEKTEFIIQII